MTPETWATATLGTIMVIASSIDDLEKEDISNSLKVLIGAAPADMVEKAAEVAAAAVADILKEA